jgi:hypothetical protein
MRRSPSRRERPASPVVGTGASVGEAGAGVEAAVAGVEAAVAGVEAAVAGVDHAEPASTGQWTVWMEQSQAMEHQTRRGMRQIPVRAS